MIHLRNRLLLNKDSAITNIDLLIYKDATILVLAAKGQKPLIRKLYTQIGIVFGAVDHQNRTVV